MTDDIIHDYLGGLDVVGLTRKYHHTNRTISRILRDARVLGTLQRRRDEARRGLPSPAHLDSQGLTCPPDAPAWPYIAGMLDGEGSIVGCGLAAGPGEAAELGRPPSVHRRYRVTIAQKDPTPLEWMWRLLGMGSISLAGGTYRYQVAGQRAVFELLQAVAPYLIVKDKAAWAALAALAVSYGWELREDQA